MQTATAAPALARLAGSSNPLQPPPPRPEPRATGGQYYDVRIDMPLKKTKNNIKPTFSVEITQLDK